MAKVIELSKFEKARLIGARAMQLSLGAPPLIKNADDFTDAIQLALEELNKGSIPLYIVKE